MQPLHAASERRAEAARPSPQAARPSPQAARHSHAFNRRATPPDRRAEPARLSGGRVKPARPSDRRAGFARLSAHKPTIKFNHPDPQANDRPRPTDTHQTQPSR
ncbi:hypothetical protein PCANC_26990 [Puccinia coronata f. sp. avenae]|uniref:Uncharacterized protein n=1 Tax=Puccinia coronata f. sp. avenae TaxID=200324 RepID=A0A2N5S231_9BASI|nr:hypothetical protein PCANC_26990 [Puccinia coronata f. sp. avenae]